MTQDLAKAKDLFTRACDGGEMNGCYGLGRLYYGGLGVTKDNQQALNLWQKTCDANISQGCYNLAFLYVSGDGVSKDPARGVRPLQEGL